MNRVSQRDAMLDRMRGGAALAVVLFHYFHKGPKEGWMLTQPIAVLSDIASYGYLGVHLFFMISGYVIMMTAQHSSLRLFMASRVSRLVPAFWICALLTVLIEWSVASAPFHLESWPQWWANMTLVPSWFGQPAIDGAYWSLASEINFYLWVALLIALGQLARIETILLFWLGLSCVNALRPMYPLQLYLNVHWAPLFASGAFFFLVRQSGWTRLRRLAIGLALVLACAYAWRENGSLGGWQDLLSLSHGRNHLAVMALVMAFFAAFLRLANSSQVSAPTSGSEWMGRLTYPLYLIHQNAGYALFNAAVALGWVAAIGRGWISLGLIVLSLGLAWLVNVAVEQRCGPALRHLIAGQRRTNAGRHGSDAAAGGRPEVKSGA